VNGTLRKKIPSSTAVKKVRMDLTSNLVWVIDAGHICSTNNEVLPKC
jgi:hypothetical protein